MRVHGSEGEEKDEPGAQGISLAGLMKDPESKRPEKDDAFIQVGNEFGLRSGKWAYMWYPATKKKKR